MYGMLKTDDPNVATQEFITKTAFAEMDENHDGKISQSEFVEVN